jgi:hypothetical protein
MPKAGAPPSTSTGWLTSGAITAGMRFHLSLSLKGITGWMFRMKRVDSFGPTFSSH